MREHVKLLRLRESLADAVVRLLQRLPVRQLPREPNGAETQVKAKCGRKPTTPISKFLRHGFHNLRLTNCLHVCVCSATGQKRSFTRTAFQPPPKAEFAPGNAYQLVYLSTNAVRPPRLTSTRTPVSSLGSSPSLAIRTLVTAAPGSASRPTQRI